MKEEHKMTPNMQLFFDKLVDVKLFVKEKYNESHDEVLNEIYKKLDAIIKQSSTVIDYDDLHIYKPSSKYNFISFCLILNNQITPLKEVT